MTALHETDTLKYSVNGPICTITMNRPQRLNAFNDEMFGGLEKAVESTLIDNSIKIVIFTGAGKAFSSGADIGNISRFHSETKDDVILQNLKRLQGLFDKIEAIPKPTIAAINGAAVGAGFQLAIACDFRIAVKWAKIGVRDIKIGIIPALGATTRLPALVGIARAKEMILTGELISPDEALNFGLVNSVVQFEDLDDAVQNLAQKLLFNSQTAIVAAKKLINTSASLDQAAVVQTSLIKSKDVGEGVKAFFEKRKPDFKNL